MHRLSLWSYVIECLLLLGSGTSLSAASGVVSPAAAPPPSILHGNERAEPHRRHVMLAYDILLAQLNRKNFFKVLISFAFCTPDSFLRVGAFILARVLFCVSGSGHGHGPGCYQAVLERACHGFANTSKAGTGWHENVQIDVTRANGFPISRNA